MESLQEALKEARPTLVEFYLPACRHCVAMEPIMEKLKEYVKDKANVIQIDASENPVLAAKYKVRNVPAWILFKDNQEVWRDAGEKPESELEDMIDRFV